MVLLIDAALRLCVMAAAEHGDRSGRKNGSKDVGGSAHGVGGVSNIRRLLALYLTSGVELLCDLPRR